MHFKSVVQTPDLLYIPGTNQNVDILIGAQYIPTMTSHIDISIVVPLLNEEEVVVELFSRLKSVCSGLGKSYEIVFVDDGSKDSTLELIKELSSKNSNLVVIALARCYGQTAALAAGIDNAKGESIVTMDGDLQHLPEDIPRFLEKLAEGYDVVSGWRELRTDSLLFRRIPSYLANWIMRKLSGIPVRDFGSTFKAYRADVLKRIELFGELHRFIPVLAHRIGARITEIPIEVHPRTLGTSNYGLGRVFGVFQDLIFLEFFSNYLTKPMRAFGKLFLLFFGTGFLIAMTLLILWVFGMISAVQEHAALLLFSAMLMVIGVQFIATGVLAELLSRIYMHTSNSKIYAVRAIYNRDS